MEQISKVKLRRQDARQQCKVILSQIISGEVETYVGYRSLYILWCQNNAAVQELRPMFRIPNAEPDGTLSVTEAFKAQVTSIAREILHHFSS